MSTAVQVQTSVSHMTPVNATTKTPTSTINVAEPTRTPNPIADWKTYTSSKYGYSVKYPNTVTIYEDNTYYHYLEFKRVGASQGEFPVFYAAAIKDDYVAHSPASVNYMSSDVINDFYKLEVGESKNVDNSTFKRTADRSIGGEGALSLKIKATGIDQDRYYIKHSGNIYMFVSDSPTTDFQNFLNNIKFTK